MKIKNRKITNILPAAYRPSHADFTYDQKFGIRDYRGGGKSSARETINWVAAGALAKHILPENVEFMLMFLRWEIFFA